MKQKVINRWYLDDVFQHDTVHNLTVYKRKDGEYVHFIKGYRKITHYEEGVPVLEIRSKTIKAYSMADIIAKINKANPGHSL